MQMEKLNNIHILKTISIVFLSLLALFLVIAIFITIDGYKKRNYKLDIKYINGNTVELSNKLPISDEIGKSYKGTGVEKGIAEYKEFILSNKNEGKINYEIYLTKTHNKNKDINNVIKTDNENIDKNLNNENNNKNNSNKILNKISFKI